MKKTAVLVFMLLSLTLSAFADDAGTAKAAPDYQHMLGGMNATVEFNDEQVIAAVANLKVYNTLDSVVLPKGIKKYRVIRAGSEQAFLIVPHFARTRMTVLKAATRKQEGALKGVFEGRSLVLFCNKNDAVVDILTRGGRDIRLVSFAPAAEELRDNGQPGGVVIPEEQRHLLKDITRDIPHDGDIIKVK